jgi:hypothetical protein
MIKKLRILLARRKLDAALRHEEEMRESVMHMRMVVLPKLEKELEAAELEYLTDDFFGH